MNAIIEGYLEDSEAEAEVPLGHRVARAGLATTLAVFASWAVTKGYDAYLNRETDEDETSDIQE